MHDKYEPSERCVIPHSFNMMPVKTNIKIKFPSRIHMTPIDCNRFDFGIPGGGGYGFGIDAENYINARIENQDEIQVVKSQIPVVKHFLHIMKGIFNYKGGIALVIHTDKNTKQHFGLGSTAMISCAVIWAVNGLFGWPLSKEDCRQILTSNFCEGYQDTYLLKGLDTGVGPYIAFNGGFVIVANKAQVVMEAKMPDEYTVLLIDNNCKRADSDLPESLDMLKRSRELDSYYRYFKSYSILMDIIPAIRENDWVKFGKLNLEFQYGGVHLSMIQGYEDKGERIYRDINDCVKAGSIITGMSSVGPAIYAITDNKEAIYELCSSKSILCSEYRFNNKGMTEVM